MKHSEEARKLFFEYRGSHFQMERNGVYEKYKLFGISKETEREWLKEMIGQFREELNRSNTPTVQYGQICSFIRQGKCSPLLDEAENILDSIIQKYDGFTALTAIECFAETLSYFERRLVNVSAGKTRLLKKISDLEMREQSLKDRLDKIRENL